MVFLRVVEDVVIFQTIPQQRRREIQQTLTANLGELFKFFLTKLNHHKEQYRDLVSIWLFCICFRCIDIRIAQIVGHSSTMCISICALLLSLTLSSIFFLKPKKKAVTSTFFFQFLSWIYGPKRTTHTSLIDHPTTKILNDDPYLLTWHY